MDPFARSPKQIGTIIRKIRRTRNFTQAQLGELTSLRQGTISNIENGDGAAKIRTVCDVLAALDLEFVVRSRSRSIAKDIEDIF